MQSGVSRAISSSRRDLVITWEGLAMSRRRMAYSVRVSRTSALSTATQRASASSRRGPKETVPPSRAGASRSRTATRASSSRRTKGLVT